MTNPHVHYLRREIEWRDDLIARQRDMISELRRRNRALIARLTGFEGVDRVDLDFIAIEARRGRHDRRRRKTQGSER